MTDEELRKLLVSDARLSAMSGPYSVHSSSAVVRDIRCLVEEVQKLRAAIRRHRDERGDDRCWRDNDSLYAVLPEGYAPPKRDTLVEVGNCLRFIASQCDPRTEYISPQREIERLQGLLEEIGAFANDMEGNPADSLNLIRELLKRAE